MINVNTWRFEGEKANLVNLGPQLHDCLHPPLDHLGLEGVDVELVRTEIVEGLGEELVGRPVLLAGGAAAAELHLAWQCRR